MKAQNNSYELISSTSGGSSNSINLFQLNVPNSQANPINNSLNSSGNNSNSSQAHTNSPLFINSASSQNNSNSLSGNSLGKELTVQKNSPSLNTPTLECEQKLKYFQNKIGVIADFGLILPLDETESMLTTINYVGTRPYSAPEILDGYRKGNSKSDLWSLGIVLFQLFFGS